MENQISQISVIGLGYIGLPTAAVIASRGVDVVGVDINPEIVANLNSGKIHIVEPELDILVQGAIASGRFRATLEPESADVFLIAVPTPFKGGYEADLSYIENASIRIAPVLKAGDLVILESTSPVGATEKLEKWLSEARPDLSFPVDSGGASDIRIAYCPERVLPGRVIHELVSNDRAIGGLSDECTKRAISFYKIFVQGRCFPTSARTAEMVKLTENAFRDVNIAFANELSLICDRLGINIWELISLANHHPRVNILQPGPGVGGHCIAVDPWFLVESAPDLANLIRAARNVNDSKPRWVVEKVKQAISNHQNPKLACLGLAFKPNIDDLRESPAVEIVKELADDASLRILAVEPHVQELPDALRVFPNVCLANVEDAIDEADIIALLVDHEVFRSIDRGLLVNKLIVDTRGFWR
jgi:UDP-N-acetyl-D-mannosaminuronic acid dehydrogenase